MTSPIRNSGACRSLTASWTRPATPTWLKRPLVTIPPTLQPLFPFLTRPSGLRPRTRTSWGPSWTSRSQRRLFDFRNGYLYALADLTTPGNINNNKNHFLGMMGGMFDLEPFARNGGELSHVVHSPDPLPLLRPRLQSRLCRPLPFTHPLPALLPPCDLC